MAPSQTPFALDVSLSGIRPLLWRRLIVARDTSLAKLHRIVQAAFGWQNSHLHEFAIGGGPVPESRERRVRLADLEAKGVRRLTYTYDFGDDWEHAIEFEPVRKEERRGAVPRCVAGARNGPPEDSGGPLGYMDLLRAVRNPKTAWDRERRDWLAPAFDPESFDLETINARLGRLR